MIELDVTRKRYFRVRGMLDALYMYREFFKDQEFLTTQASLKEELQRLRRKLFALEKRLKNA